MKLLQSFALPYAPDMKVQKWKSTRTGLTLVWADFPSPLLNAYMTVPTEIFTDSGVPHTLEHLIFLGSHNYPYKGILDSLANRSFASGTNAWTANDHTAYTLTTASSDGFLRMLPVYADHIFRPTITDAGFTTEVYHVDGKGHDAGVVFSEMQGRENTSADLMELRMQRSLYPEGNAYRSETGGLMDKLRILTAQEIRDYHAKYYAPHNAALVVTGPLPLGELIETVNAIDDGLLAAGKAPGPSGPPGWLRPFLETPSSTPPVIDGAKRGEVDDSDAPSNPLRRQTTVEFPEEDESMGEVYISWVGPKMGSWLEEEALSVLSTYLTDSAVSPVQRAFVERDDPLCTDVYLSQESKAGSGIISALFTSVPTAKLRDLDGELVKLLEGIVKDGVDMERMQLCIRRDRIKLMNHLETKTSESFADVLIQDHLYGEAAGKDLATSMDDMVRYDQLAKWTPAQWGELIQRWLIANARLVVLGKPSKALVKSLRRETKALEKERKAQLGEAGLKDLADKLEKARAENDRPIPDEILSGFRIPSEESIQWIQSGRKLVGTAPIGGAPTRGTPINDAATPLDKVLDDHLAPELNASLPFPVHFTQVPSAFLSVSLVFPTTHLAPRLRPLLQLYLSTLFSLPLQRLDGAQTQLSYEDVVRGLDDDTVEYDAGLGVGGGFAENICIELKVERARYSEAVAWLRDLIWGSQFSLDRLRVSAAKTTQSLPELKRDGRGMSWSLLRSLTHDAEASSNVATSVLRMLEFMPVLNDRLANEAEAVVADLEEVRRAVFKLDNMVAAVGGDVVSSGGPALEPWLQLATSVKGAAASTPVLLPWSHSVLTPLGRSPSKTALIASLPTVESSYAVFTARGPDSYAHPDHPALVVTVAMLNALESVLWRHVRGAGLAYGASLRIDVEAAQLHFSLYRAPDSARAFQEAKRVVQAVAGVKEWKGGAASPPVFTQTDLDSAKSLLHYNVAEGVSTVSLCASEVFVDEALRCAPAGRRRGRALLSKVAGVTLEDVQRVLREWVCPVFESQTSIAAVVGSEARAGEIEKCLREEEGYECERRTLPASAGAGKEGSASEDEEMSGSESGSGSESESGVESESGSDSEDSEKK